MHTIHLLVHYGYIFNFNNNSTQNNYYYNIIVIINIINIIILIFNTYLICFILLSINFDHVFILISFLLSIFF